jgi:hypothetical protein
MITTMIVRVENGTVRLDGPRDFTALALVTDPHDPAVLELGAWLDDEHVVMPAERLVSLAGPIADEPGWRQDFNKMLEYARGKGWVDELGGVRVHVRRQG